MGWNDQPENLLTLPFAGLLVPGTHNFDPAGIFQHHYTLQVSPQGVS